MFPPSESDVLPPSHWYSGILGGSLGDDRCSRPDFSEYLSFTPSAHCTQKSGRGVLDISMHLQYTERCPLSESGEALLPLLPTDPLFRKAACVLTYKINFGILHFTESKMRHILLYFGVIHPGTSRSE